MKNRQNEARDRLNQYIVNHGVKACWISKKCGLYPSLISAFRRGTKDLWAQSLEVVENFLDEVSAKKLI